MNVDIAADVDFRISEHCYSIAYTVAAPTELAAIEAAVALLRSDVRVRGVNSVTRVGALWRVSLNVHEAAS